MGSLKTPEASATAGPIPTPAVVAETTGARDPNTTGIGARPLA